MSSSRVKILLLSVLAVFAFSAVVSASASAFKLEWEVCETQTGGKFENHLCGVEGPPGGWEWKKLVGTINVTSEQKTAFKLIAAGKEVKCAKVKDKGTLTGGSPGKDETTEVKFTECTTSVAACKVHSPGQPAGTILTENIPTKLTERETSTKVKVLADVFEQNVAKKEFVTFQFEPKTSCEPTYFETKVTGQVAQECKNNTTTGEIESVFPEPELKGNTLNAFGIAAKLTGTVMIKRENGWGIRCV